MTLDCRKIDIINTTLLSTSTLADMKIPNLSLTEGRLCGLGGLHTQGQVEFEERQDTVYLSGQVWADNLEIHFTWQHNNIRSVSQ